MKSNYDILGNHIRLIDTRNRESITDRVLGINIDKFFMPSVANVIGTDLSKYKLITKGKFACNPMHVGRDERLPVALYDEEEPAIVSPAYFMFEVVDNSILNEDYLMMWFRRPEFDRICWLHTDGSVRGGITWDDICRLELPIPPIENQLEIVNSYKAITERIALKQKINDNLEAPLIHIFFKMFLEISRLTYIFSDTSHLWDGGNSKGGMNIIGTEILILIVKYPVHHCSTGKQFDQ
ncbi:restriction endonuclease subunit S [[Ruminococcus] lactaris]|uniref:restriction endonuclease subunit S n=1 Tax=[Ruminococcus] lactaris TaxID=46228 RepID=UPI0035202335